MSDLSSAPHAKHKIDAHVWIAAFAVVQIVIALVFMNNFNTINEVLCASAQAHQKTTREVAALQQEIVSLRKMLEASRVEPSKTMDGDVPARAEHGDASAHGRVKN